MNQESASVSYNPKGHSFSGWMGGKSQLAKTIVELMPPHLAYIEVFGGAGWVLFKKTPSFENPLIKGFSLFMLLFRGAVMGQEMTKMKSYTQFNMLFLLNL